MIPPDSWSVLVLIRLWHWICCAADSSHLRSVFAKNMVIERKQIIITNYPHRDFSAIPSEVTHNNIPHLKGFVRAF